MTTAAQAATVGHEAVMATRPASTPGQIHPCNQRILFYAIRIYSSMQSVYSSSMRSAYTHLCNQRNHVCNQHNRPPSAINPPSRRSKRATVHRVRECRGAISVERACEDAKTRSGEAPATRAPVFDGCDGNAARAAREHGTRRHLGGHSRA
mmetsp:Transcript_5431/g.14319  ORF Transcript_5431/g.14319 Transcript_5431/m.14319 type:complete len:151 (-) Transcript_5431:856-1308(-)